MPSKGRHSERAAGFALGLGSLGDSLPQGEFLSRDTNPLGVAAGRLLHFVNQGGNENKSTLASYARELQWEGA